MSTIKPLTSTLFKRAIKTTKYPKKQVSAELINTMCSLTNEQIKDGKATDEIASYLGLALANRLPRDASSVELSLMVSAIFRDANQ